MKKKKPLYVAKKSGYSAFKHIVLDIYMVLMIAPLCALIHTIISDYVDGRGMFHAFYSVLPDGTFSISFINIIVSVIALLPFIIELFIFIRVKSWRLKIYKTHIEISEGVLFGRVRERRLFIGTTQVIVDENFLFGNLFGMGNVRVFCPAGFDFTFTDIYDPYALKNCLSELFVARKNFLLHGALRSTDSAN